MPLNPKKNKNKSGIENVDLGGRKSFLFLLPIGKINAGDNLKKCKDSIRLNEKKYSVLSIFCCMNSPSGSVINVTSSFI